MSNFSRQFQEEVRRLARKETKSELSRLKQEQAALRHQITALEKRLTELERKEAHPAGALEATVSREDAAIERVRISATTVRRLRQRLGLTQAELGKLVGVSGQSVYQWEQRSGRLQLRRKTVQALLRVKRLGVREARTALQESE